MLEELTVRLVSFIFVEQEFDGRQLIREQQLRNYPILASSP